MTIAKRENPDAFARLDKSEFGWSQFRSVLVAGAGFFGDAYDIFVIGLALPMVYRVYYPPAGNDPNLPSTFEKDSPWIDSILKASTNWGNIIGQLFFGFLGDTIGRRKVYGVEIVVMFIAIIGSTLASSTVRGISVLAMLGFWRFILGLGIGGDYPLSATITSEFAHSSRRGMMIAAVFAMQGLGILAGGLLTILFLFSFSSLIEEDILHLDYVWRIMLGAGAIPCVCTFYYRFTMPESPRYKSLEKKPIELSDSMDLKENRSTGLKAGFESGVNNSDDQAVETRIMSSEELRRSNSSGSCCHSADKKSFLKYLSVRKNALRLFASSYCWFALDVGWYGLTINTQLVLDHLGFGKSASASQYDVLWKRSLGSVVIAICGTVPGYWVTVFTVDKIGRKPIQFVGFVVIAAILLLLGIFWDFFSSVKMRIPFLVLFTIAQFFFNFGPNQTTFIYPAELFPTRFRSRAHGISACFGKVGAILGVQMAASLFNKYPSFILILFSFIMGTGAMATLILPETKNRTLEDISGEKEFQSAL